MCGYWICGEMQYTLQQRQQHIQKPNTQQHMDITAAAGQHSAYPPDLTWAW